VRKHATVQIAFIMDIGKRPSKGGVHFTCEHHQFVWKDNNPSGVTRRDKLAADSAYRRKLNCMLARHRVVTNNPLPSEPAMRYFVVNSLRLNITDLKT